LQEITLGEMLENSRIEKGISKLQLCDGICSVMALGRYEKDERIPDKFVIDCLLERLDKNPEKLEFIDSDDEFSLRLYRDEIESAIEKGIFSKAEELLENYKNEIKTASHLHHQYIAMKSGEILAKQKQYQQALTHLEKALTYTNRASILKSGIENMLLSYTEIEILYQIASIHYFLSNDEISNMLFLSLENFLNGLSEYNEKKIYFFPNVLYYRGVIEKEHFNYGAAYDYLCKAEQILRNEYRFDGLLNIMKSRIDVEKQIKSPSLDTENEESMVLALEMAAMCNEEGLLTQEGVKLWENTANQQL